MPGNLITRLLAFIYAATNFSTFKYEIMKSIKILLMAVLSIIAVTVFAQTKAGKKDPAKGLPLYTCSTHDTLLMKKPGNCPICGMKLQLSSKEQMKSDVNKTYTCPTHPDVVSDKPGTCSKCGMSLNLSPKEKMKADIAKTYTCSMHPDVYSEKPGTCPVCGMKLNAEK